VSQSHDLFAAWQRHLNALFDLQITNKCCDEWDLWNAAGWGSW